MLQSIVHLLLFLGKSLQKWYPTVIACSYWPIIYQKEWNSIRNLVHVQKHIVDDWQIWLTDWRNKVEPFKPLCKTWKSAIQLCEHLLLFFKELNIIAILVFRKEICSAKGTLIIAKTTKQIMQSFPSQEYNMMDIQEDTVIKVQLSCSSNSRAWC